MGPIRAFSRPSLAAGQFVASASPYSHTSGFSDARRPCYTHVGTSLGSQLSVLPHSRLYDPVCAADPLHASLVTTPAAPPPCLLHFKKLLPPGAAQPDTHLAAPAHEDAGGAGQGATSDAAGHETRKKDITEQGRKNGGEYECKDTAERKSKKKSRENIWKRHKQESKWNQHNGVHKRSAKKSEYVSKLKKFGDDTESWVRNREENKQKNKKNKVKCSKPHREPHGARSEEEHECGSERREAKQSKDSAAPPSAIPSSATAISRTHDDPGTSRMHLSFPFSDDDDDDDYGHEGKSSKGSNDEPWPISDIVETEDEAENRTRPVQDSAGDECESQHPFPATIRGPAMPGTESAGVVHHRRLPSADDDGGLILMHNEQESEAASSSEQRGGLAWHDGSAAEGKTEMQKESDMDDENDLEEQVEHETEGKRRPSEEEYPRDGVRATQRLRPRSYRQFLLTRERRSRVFLKARSYHLGRWFVTHFTHPYPSKDQKDQLAARTSMTRNQVSEWFGNMRRRIREATRGRGVCWEERVRLYNTVITGKSEPLPILPGDAINTWVPPVAEAEPPNLDQQEEVCASPKFKKALMQRYLNTSFEAPLHHPSGGDSRPSSTPTSFTLPEEDTNLSYGHYNKFSESPKPGSVTSNALPLCTSSPKESFQARWNSSFQRVKINKIPAVMTRFPDKADSRVKPFGGRGQGEEGKKVVRKYERQRSQENASTNIKRLKTDRDSFQSSSPCGSSSLVPNPQHAAVEAWRTLASTSTAQFPPSAWMGRRPFIDVRSSDEEGVAGCSMRKPEELAAAYTLMELHTDTAAAVHFMAAAPRPPPLSS